MDGAPSRKKRRARRASLVDRLALWCSTGKNIDGLWVGVWDDKPERHLRRVEEALSLIKTCDRIRYDRLNYDLKRIWVLLLPGPSGSYAESLNACKLDARFVLDERLSPDVIATVIVHEATHARLCRCGLGYDESLRSRVEAVCIRRELAFARRLPDGDGVREWAEAQLKSYAVPDMLTDEAREKRYVEGSLEALRHLGTPAWMVRSAVPLRMLILKVRRRIRSLMGFS